MRIQGGILSSGAIAHVSDSKSRNAGTIKLLWTQKSFESHSLKEIFVPVYTNEDRSDVLFSVRMEAEDDLEVLTRKAVAFFI
jgi:hypothetical protein